MWKVHPFELTAERIAEVPARLRHARPQTRVPAQAEFTHGDPWRVLRILGEYVHGFDALAEVGAAIAAFGSARTPATDPMYEAARELGRCVAGRASPSSPAAGRASWRRPTAAPTRPAGCPSAATSNCRASRA
jgi:hypothetical protein